MSYASMGRKAGGGGGSSAAPLLPDPGSQQATASGVGQEQAANQQVQSLTPLQVVMTALGIIPKQPSAAADPTRGAEVVDTQPKGWFGQPQQFEGVTQGRPWPGTTTGGQSAYAQYRAGEQQATTPAAASPTYVEGENPQGQFSDTPTAYSSGYAAGSPESTQGGPVTAGQAGTDWGAMWDRVKKGLSAAGKTPLLQSSYTPISSPPVQIQGPTEAPMEPFMMTPYQSRILGQMGLSGEHAQQFIANQIMSGNPQFGPYTRHQIAAAQRLFGGGKG